MNFILRCFGKVAHGYRHRCREIGGSFWGFDLLLSHSNPATASISCNTVLSAELSTIVTFCDNGTWTRRVPVFILSVADSAVADNHSVHSSRHHMSVACQDAMSLERKYLSFAHLSMGSNGTTQVFSEIAAFQVFNSLDLHTCTSVTIKSSKTVNPINRGHHGYSPQQAIGTIR